ncbi:hypothetical protein A1A1_18492 [Planococcus antarcticus DSM 14505]|uniref:Uncharacterized protein n=1 Tax=Planococcus antarcticus DSM 14505 TaxID=1185653 RepID=A0A1C7DH77_9BACL|nr:hypothetical protein [Planococcus antarcticus]ANU10762.1 hypothetical protein BBH88_10815 [Planococcus antarcticus DSM 14505]EIM04995.1 hypothetical protein A1A1_18492 [Planococcus antarcticus DSM 14505]
MRLTKDQLEVIAKTLNDRGVSKVCSACGKKEPVIVEELLFLGKSTSGKFPLIVTGCGHCGLTQSFAVNRLVPGLFSKVEVDKEK